MSGRRRTSRAWGYVGLRGRLLVPFLLVALVAVAVAGGLTWWVSDWAAERSFDRGLGDKLELAAELVRQVARDRLEETRRLAGKNPYLRGHSDRVARMAVAVGERLGFATAAGRALGMIARFHDVGKVCIDSSILLNPGRLTAEEFAAIQRHVEIGEAIVGQIPSLRDRAAIVGRHRERWDGRGYVRGLGGGDIRLEARIVAVADAFDAMTSDRPYRASRDRLEAAREIRECAGRQFDPAIAGLFADLVLTGGAGAATSLAAGS